MLRETGLVTAVDGQYAQVQTKSQLACSSCRVSSSCGNGIIEKYLSGKIFVTEIINSANAKVGQQVIIEIPKASITKASIVVYLVPIFLLLAVALTISSLGASENQVIIASLLGLTFGLLVTKYYNRKWLNGELYLPNMVSIVDTQLNKKSKLESRRINSIDIN